jgi:hypothetical protein
LGACRVFSARRRNASKVLMGLTAITVSLLAFAAGRQHAPCRSRDAQEIVESLGTTFLGFPYLLQRRVSRPESPWTLTDACVVIEDPGANATSFDRKASEVAKAPTRSVQFPAIYFARATRSSAAASVSKISSLGTAREISISFRFPGFSPNPAQPVSVRLR